MKHAIKVLEQMKSLNEQRDQRLLHLLDLWKLYNRRKRQMKLRSPPVYRRRWDEAYFLDLARREKTFRKEYRMSEDAFYKLHDMLRSYLEVNPKKADAAVGNDPRRRITTQSRLGAALIMLGGGRSMEAMRTHGLGEKTVYENFRRVIRAINACDELAIKCDNSIEALEQRAEEFNQLSSIPELFQFCTGAIDGLAIHIECPRNTKNQIRYFSGNKIKYTINMQGVCDAKCKFIAIACKHVGSTNDGIAFEYSSLKDACIGQRFPHHWVGDNAYPNMETLMTPYPGLMLHVIEKDKETFNFFHSQLRITIERCFGIFVKRFRIFARALTFDIDFVAEIVHACCRLHNYLMDLKEPLPKKISKKEKHSGVLDLNADGTLAHEQWRLEMEEEAAVVNELLINDESSRVLKLGGCALREQMLEEISKQGIVRIRHHNLQ